MNLLGKVDAWDNLIRIKSESIVQELMGMILKEFCDNYITSSIQKYAVLSHFVAKKPHIFCSNDLTSSGAICVVQSIPQE